MIYPYKKKKNILSLKENYQRLLKQEIRGKKKNQGFFQIRINCGEADSYEHNLMASVYLHMCCQCQKKSGVNIFFFISENPISLRLAKSVPQACNSSK